MSFLLSIAVMLAAAKIGGELCERYLKQPAVLAEIVVGILLGRSVLGWINGSDVSLQQVASIGAVLLLFEVGLESDLQELFKVGREAMYVATCGVVVQFALGYAALIAVGMKPFTAIFCGAALTATSVGITARVFSDLRVLHTKEARIVLGAAVADDVMGLIILAAVSGLAAAGSVSAASIARTTAIAVLFLALAIILGLKATPFLLKWARAMRTRAAVSMAAVVVCLLIASLADLAQLAPMVGAFAAGIVLAKTDEKIHFDEKVRSIGDLFVPVFFVMMGARADLHSFSSTTALIALILFVIALVGKMLAGITLPVRGVGRFMVGVGMIPRGEVALIFASIGQAKGILSSDLYAAIILVIIASTFITPPLLQFVSARTPEPELA